MEGEVRAAGYSRVMFTLNILSRKGRNSLRLPRTLTILSPRILACLAGIASWTVSASAEPTAGVISPDGSLAVTVDVQGPLTYQVQLDGKPLLAPSRLGLAFGDGLKLGEQVQLLGVEQRTSDTWWRNDFGKSSKVRDHFNETRIHFKEIRPAPASPVLFDVVVRAYDDGVALRYDLPAQKDLSAFTLTTDQTTFTFPQDARALGGRWAKYFGEVQYPETRLAALPDSKMCLPVVAQTDHATVAIAEADVRDWAGMFIKGHKQQNAPLFSSATLTGQSPPLVIDVDVSKLPDLVLETTEADDGYTNDHTVWADASLVRADGSEVSLSSLTPVAATQGYGKLQKNLTVNGKPITLRGKIYAQGLGTHSASRIKYALKTEGSPFVRFKAVVGIDDATSGKGSAVFRVANTVHSGPVTLGAELASNVVSATPRQSPWRVLLVGRNPGTLIESNIMVYLATPSQIADTSWIRPGIMAWDKWWSINGYGNMASNKEYIDLASEMGWPYMQVDWGWCDPVMPGVVPHDPNAELKVNGTIDLPALFAYAGQKNVKLMLWLHYNNVNRIGIDKTLATVKKWGAAGVKIDFMDRSDQDIVKWYEEVLASAAKHQLVVNFHGAYTPTGLARTWPNYITQEAILGNEYNKMGGYCDPKHHITLPFTRNLLGPGDFTPGGFLNRSVSQWRKTSPTQVMGTRARQLALATVLDSPLLCMADSPANYRGQTGLEYFRGLPTVWDETRVLSADLAEHLVEARRKGDIWYIAAMNHDKPLTLRVPLDFLGKGAHTIRIFADKPESATTATEITDTTRPITAKDSLEIPMVGDGGFAACIRPSRTQ